MRFGLSKETISKINSVFADYTEIDEVIIYGSRSKGNFREGSDIDITLKGEKVTDSIRSKIWLDLDELNTPYLFDVSVFHHLASDSLQDHIKRVGKVLYSNA